MVRWLSSCALGILLLASAGPAQGIPWEKSWEEARERARKESKVLFLAVNMDGERANDRLAKKVYKDRQVVSLLKLTVNVVASKFDHGGSSCKRFDGIDCKAHQAIDMRVRADILKADTDGYVIAPQHLWLDHEGQVLLSVPYEIGVDELAWCFVTAIHKHDEQSEVTMPKGARAPRRLVLEGVVDSSQAAEQAPIGREEALELIEELKKVSLGGSGRRGGGGGRATREIMEKLNRLIRADEPEAIKFTSQVMRSALMSRGNGERMKTLVRRIGDVSPPSYWEVLADHVKCSDDDNRAEVAIALEQLAAEKSLKAIKAALRAERIEDVKKNWLRALGSVGASDKGAHRILLSAARAKGSEQLRVNAIIAMGSTRGDEKICAFLLQGLHNPLPNERKACALALAITREASHAEEIRRTLREERDAEVKALFELCTRILEGGNLTEIGSSVQEVAGDESARPRIFGGERW